MIAIGAVHVLPGAVALSISKARTAYGIEAAGPDLAVLLRHRAILLAMVGVGLIVAAFLPSLRAPAMTAAAISMTSFIAIALQTGDLNRRTRRVLHIDLYALAGLAVATVLLLIAR